MRQTTTDLVENCIILHQPDPKGRRMGLVLIPEVRLQLFSFLVIGSLLPIYVQSAQARCSSTWSLPWPCSASTSPVVLALVSASPSCGSYFSLPAPLSAGIDPCTKPSGVYLLLGFCSVTLQKLHWVVSYCAASLVIILFPLLGVTAPSTSLPSSSFSLPKWSSLSSWPSASLDGGSGKVPKQISLC